MVSYLQVLAFATVMQLLSSLSQVAVPKLAGQLVDASIKVDKGTDIPSAKHHLNSALCAYGPGFAICQSQPLHVVCVSHDRKLVCSGTPVVMHCLALMDRLLRAAKTSVSAAILLRSMTHSLLQLCYTRS